MSVNFIDFKERENLKPLKVNNKEVYYQDLMNIEQSWIGRMDAQITNTFVFEAVQLVKNAIVLFEKGYFDCAYYSLRQSLEVSTTMIYLTELDSEEKERELGNWKNQSRFPMYGQMLKILNDKSNVFKEMKHYLRDYFNEIQDVKNKLNKYVHKQGFNTFYVSRNHPMNGNRDNKVFLEDFNNYIRSCIGAIAVLRLAIDPFPVLLMDEDIYMRTDDLLMEGYSEEFVLKYIGNDYISAYKNTQLYKNYYDQIINEEERLPSVVDLIKHQYIDKEKFDEILLQAHLLSRVDVIAIALTSISNKAAKIYFYGGLLFYFTSTKSVRKDLGFDSRVFKEFMKDNAMFNNPYDEAFITCAKVHDIDLYIEHNEQFNNEEMATITDSIKNFQENINPKTK